MSKYSKAKVRDLLHKSDNAPTADLKGDIFEQLICYLFSKFKGVSVLKRNFLDAQRSQEIDIAFWVDIPTSPLCFLESMLFVECKNTCAPIGSPEVSRFVVKLKKSVRSYGILISLSGVTGNPAPPSHAYHEILIALLSFGISVILITREDILNLNTSDDLVGLIKTKLTKLILYATPE